MLLIVLILAIGSAAQAKFTIEVHFGTSSTATSILEISQAGYPDVVIPGVRYETRAWLPVTSLPLVTQNYYSARLGYYLKPAISNKPDLGFELELLHDKVYYVSGHDPDHVVQHFELSDGVNYLMLNGVVRYPFEVSPAYPRGRTQILARAGAGPVVSAPASTIRGQGQGHDLHGTGQAYELAGFGFQVAAQARQFLLPWLAFSFETKYTYSSPSQSIADGMSRTYLPTMHVNFGLTFTPGQQNAG